MKLGDFLIQKRLAKRMGQNEAADSMKIDRSRLSRIERGTVKIYGDEISRVVRVLDISEIELLRIINEYREGCD